MSSGRISAAGDEIRPGALEFDRGFIDTLERGFDDDCASGCVFIFLLISNSSLFLESL